jgi:hypothetical protein
LQDLKIHYSIGRRRRAVILLKNSSFYGHSASITMNIAPLLFFIQLLWSIPNLPIFKTANASRFEVRSLPDSPALPANWAGRLPVPGRKDGNEVFFWLFEAENKAYDDTFISGLAQNRSTNEPSLLTTCL